MLNICLCLLQVGVLLKTAEWITELVFDMGASFHLSLTVFERNLGYLQKLWFFPMELCLNSGHGKFCFGVSIVDNTFNKIYIALNCKSCNKPLCFVDAHSTINCTVVSPTLDRWITSNHQAPSTARFWCVSIRSSACWYLQCLDSLQCHMKSRQT